MSRDLTIVGVTHGKNNDLVKETISNNNFDVICVESCISRMKLYKIRDHNNIINYHDSEPESIQVPVIRDKIMKISKNSSVESPYNEIDLSVQYGLKENIPVHLVDKNIYKINEMVLNLPRRYFYSFAFKNILGRVIRDYDSYDQHNKGVRKTLIEERNKVISNNISNIGEEYDDIVLVTGISHVRGITSRVDSFDSIEVVSDVDNYKNYLSSKNNTT